MSNLTLPPHEQAFLRQHDACEDAMEWLAAGQFTSLEEAWQVCERGDWMIWLLDKTNSLDAATWRHLAVDFAQQVRHLMTDERGLNALEVARRYASGQATEVELAAAGDAARDAAYAAAAAAAGRTAYAAQANLIRARVPHAPTIAD